jgi:hypothetical protein
MFEDIAEPILCETREEVLLDPANATCYRPTLRRKPVIACDQHDELCGDERSATPRGCTFGSADAHSFVNVRATASVATGYRNGNGRAPEGP